jgi:hypothetical protein
MTNEERQRTMDFILAQQLQFWASVQKHDEEFAEFRARDEERQATHEARQERYEARQARLAATQRRTDAQVDLGLFRTDRLERILKLLIKAGIRGRRQLREQGHEFDRRMNELRQTQAHSDRRLDALIDIVREQRNGSA